MSITQLTAKDAANAVNSIADRPDRTWLFFLMVIGIVVMGFILKWHREDQAAMVTLFSETLKTNNEVLTKVAGALERLDRKPYNP